MAIGGDKALRNERDSMVSYCKVLERPNRLVTEARNNSLLCSETFAGTDDDLPPSHQNRFQRGGRTSGNGRSAAVGSAPLSRMHGDMEIQIHRIEQEAYCSVLRAFSAQSDALTWVAV